MLSIHTRRINTAFLTQAFAPLLVSFFSNYLSHTPDSQLSVAFFLLFMGFMSLLYLICALRTNITFVAIFFGLFMTFVLLTGAYWEYAIGHGATALNLQKVSRSKQAIRASMADGLPWSGWWSVWIYGVHRWMVCTSSEASKNAPAHDGS